jgi:mRNA interferase MazF
MKRGAIYSINLPKKSTAANSTRQLCVIISPYPLNQARSTVIVVPLAHASKAIAPLTIEMHSIEKNCIALCDQVRTISKKRLAEFIGELPAKDLNKLDQALRQVLSL